MKKNLLFLAGCAVLLMASCKEKDLYVEPANNHASEANTFDFSTIQDVTLNVDYSAYQTHGPVFFSVYNEYPFEGEGESMQLKQGLNPIFESYTDAEGKFNDAIQLPAYAKELYVVTGNFFVMESVIAAEFNNGVAKAIATNQQEAASRAARAVRRAGTPTTNMETLYQLSHEVNVENGDKKDVQVYKEWLTPLGSWDSESGRPEYLLKGNDVKPELLFTAEEKEGLYQTISNALVANQTCNETYRVQADLLLDESSEVSVTFLGGTTCWNNSVGYYYYNESNKPTSPMDLNIIMLFPNTQDGKWSRTWMRNPDFYGNIALNRGEAVLLKYYPNIAQGDLSVEETVFPKGTRIGFILKPNGWGMQKVNGDKKYFNSYRGEGKLKNNNSQISRQYNVWASSTEGLSYCNPEQIADDKGAIALPNPTGASRTAKFAYRNDNGDEFAIVSFEDACNDLDFDDVVFALKPVNAFADLPVVENKKTTSTSVYAYEDLWPSQGDYDMNDAVLEVKHTKEFSKKSNEQDYKIVKETFELTTDQNYVTKTSGLALTLNTKVAPQSIVMKKVAAHTTDTVSVSYTVEGNVYLLTDDIKGELNSTYILELNYKNGITGKNTATVNPFIFRTESADKRWEVHIPFEAPTKKMNMTYFGMEDDRSVPSEGKYFVRSGDYPFAFCLAGVSIANFKETILNRDNEKVKISELYPGFLEWSVSKGEKNADWYLHPRTK